MEYMDFKKKDDRDVLQLERFPMEKGELPVLHYPLLDACGMVKHCQQRNVRKPEFKFYPRG